MGFRFRKSVKVGGVRLNFSKSGTSVSIPGTGISYKPSKNKNCKKKASNTSVNVSKNPVINNTNSMFDKFNLTFKEAELLTFLIDNKNNLEETFTLHDVACLGYVSTNTYYNHLYNKGLLTKPIRGKYALNTQMLECVAKDWQDKQDAIARFNAERERVALERKEKQRKLAAWVCKALWLPMIILGCLIALVEPMTGFISIAAGVFEKVYSKKYFNTHRHINFM